MAGPLQTQSIRIAKSSPVLLRAIQNPKPNGEGQQPRGPARFGDAQVTDNVGKARRRQPRGLPRVPMTGLLAALRHGCSLAACFSQYRNKLVAAARHAHTHATRANNSGKAAIHGKITLEKLQVGGQRGEMSEVR